MIIETNQSLEAYCKELSKKKLYSLIQNLTEEAHIFQNYHLLQYQMVKKLTL